MDTMELTLVTLESLFWSLILMAYFQSVIKNKYGQDATNVGDFRITLLVAKTQNLTATDTLIRCCRVTWPKKDEFNCYKDANEVLELTISMCMVSTYTLSRATT
ncbi:hypothetical protein Tco_1358959 [Tanacetum coccineum]